MYVDCSLKELSGFDFTFSFRNNTYIVRMEEGRRLCQQLVFHPLNGYQCVIIGTDRDVHRVGQKILDLAARFPEKYRMAGEHYVVNEHFENERVRYGIRREKTLLKKTSARCVPFLLRFLMILLTQVGILYFYGDRIIRWLSVLFPALNYRELLITLILTYVVLELTGLLLLNDAPFLNLLIYSAIPSVMIIAFGFLCDKDLFWIYRLSVALALLFIVVIFFIKKEWTFKRRFAEGMAVLFVFMLATCILVSAVVVVVDIEPHTYGNTVAVPAGTSHEVLEQRYAEACEELKKPSFSEREPEEKLEILQVLCDYECIVILGCNSPKVCAEWLDRDYVAGEYHEDSETIVIDVECLIKYQTAPLIELVLHELRHHYQHRVVELYDTLLPHLTENNQNLAYLEQAKEFKLNHMDYKEYGRDGEEAYRDQCIEKDSRSYARKRMAEYYLAMLENES